MSKASVKTDTHTQWFGQHRDMGLKTALVSCVFLPAATGVAALLYYLCRRILRVKAAPPVVYYPLSTVDTDGLMHERVPAPVPSLEVPPLAVVSSPSLDTTLAHPLPPPMVPATLAPSPSVTTPTVTEAVVYIVRDGRLREKAPKPKRPRFQIED